MTITEHEPGALCQREPTKEELFELRELCIGCKSHLEGVYSMIATLNMRESFNNVDEPINDVGAWLDSIAVYCTRACKRDTGKKKLKWNLGKTSPNPTNVGQLSPTENLC